MTEHQPLLIRDYRSTFESLFRNAPEAICVLDGSDCLVTANPAFERLFGYTTQELAGKSLRGVIIPAGRESELDVMTASLRSGGTARLETTRMRRDGSLIQVVISLFPVTDAPGERLFFAVYSDVQHLRDTQRDLALAETRYHSIFEHAAEGIFQSTPAGTYLVVNPALARIYGYDSPAELTEGLRDISRQLYVDAGRREEFVRLITAHGEVTAFESRVYRKDGSVIWISENARLVADPDGRTTFFEGTVTDITARKEAEDSLKASRERYRSLVRSATDAILTLKDMVITDCNIKAQEMFGYGPDQMKGLGLEDLSPPLQADGEPSAALARELLGQALEGQARNFGWVHQRRDGTQFYAEVSVNRFDAHGEVFLTAQVRDISVRKRAEDALQRERAHLKMLFEGSPHAIVLVSPEGRILDVNHAFTTLFGHARADVEGEYNRHLIVPPDLVEEAESFNAQVSEGKTVCKETVRRARNGTLIPVSLLGYPVRIGGTIEAIYYIYEDITERKGFEEQLTHQAFHDALTGLPNRSLFMERLSRAMERSKRRTDYNFAVLLLDLDRFKRINDSLGHQAGDVLLKGIARRLESCLRTVDTVARLGGDEFAVLLEEFKSSREVIDVADRIHEVLDRPFHISGNEVYSGASIGIVLRTRGYETAEEILRDSDIAMYRTKESGKDRLAFTRRMHEMAVENLRMENELRHGLKHGQLSLHFQPIIVMANSRIEGFEALARWNHPERGPIAPARFIPLAEETGLILPLGEWVLLEALRTLARWRQATPKARELYVAVNISSKQFRQPDLVEFIRHALGQYGVPPPLLRLEITESVLMQDAKGSVEKLAQLKNLGVKLLIDDFGTGYSSLSYLQRFPIDGLKIDRSFISGQGDERENLEIVRTILALARNLELAVVAEGVETAHQHDSLNLLRCRSAQGYLFSRPLPADGAMDMILTSQG